MPGIDNRIRMLVVEDHDADRPGPRQYEGWCHKTAAKYDITVSDVKKIIAVDVELLRYQMNQERATTAQHAAMHSGLTMEKVLSTLNEGLDAYKCEFHKGERGMHIVDENGDAVYTKVPDFTARAHFAREAIKVLGMEAPEQINLDVSAEVKILNVSDTELYARAMQLAERIATLVPQSQGASGVRALHAGTDGAASAEGHAVLDAALHGDGGRAGRARARNKAPVS